MSSTQHVETDYLVVGAGAMGMAFVDQLIEDPDVDVVMLDRRHGPGGHWLDAYPFVRLHQPSAIYGVHSTPLGLDRPVATGPEAGLLERATGPEICGYYDQVMQHRLLASGRVRFFPMSDYLGERRFRSLLSGDVTDVTVRRRVVDATFMASRVPATEPPPFEVADEVTCVPVGEMARQSEPAEGYVVIGAGKTGYDACCWLLDQGTDPEAITWVRPRDSWMQNREFTQPEGGVVRALESVVTHLEALAACDTVEEVYARLEAQDVMLRIDPGVAPQIMRGATLSTAELAQLRRIENVVRLGYVERIEADQIIMARGSIPTTPNHLHVHCAAPGLSDQSATPIFAEESLTLQVITQSSLSLSGAMIGFLEATGRSTEDKNRLAPPNPWPHTPYDWLRFLVLGIETNMAWGDAPDLQSFVDSSRLNIVRALSSSDDPAVPQLQARMFEAVFPAIEKVKAIGDRGNADERRRIYAGSP